MNLFEVAAALTLNTRAYEKGLNDAKKETSSFASGIGGALKSVGSGFAKLAQAGIAAFAAVGAAAGGIAKKAIGEYAEFEQLSGGIQKLFGEGAAEIQKNAEKAYATAGMSTNEYLQNITGFSASLIKSLKGDTVKAAQLADMAMRDISDNANTYGKYTIEEITQVYQAIAKGNYQTLDNLNLGFAGTKTGMQNLIDEANKLRRKNGEMGDLTIAKYSDIIEAIHLVQTEMHVSGLSQEEAAEMVAQGLMTEEEAYEAMGTTAKEATKTITGSLNQTKKAFENFIAGLANPSADIEQLISNVVVSAGYAFDNLIPTIERTIDGLTTSLEKFAPKTEEIAERIGNMAVNISASITKAMPTLISAGGKMLVGLLNGFSANSDKILSAVTSAIKTLVGEITRNLPTVLKAGKEIISTVISGISSIVNSREMLDAAVEIIQTFAHSLAENIGPLLQAGVELALDFLETLTDPQVLSDLTDAAVELLDYLGTAIISNLSTISDRAGIIVENLARGLSESIPKLLDVAFELLISLLQQIANEAFSVEAAQKYIEIEAAIYDGIVSVFLGEDWHEIFDSITAAFENHDWSSLGEAFLKSLKKTYQASTPFGWIWKGGETWLANDEQDFTSVQKDNYLNLPPNPNASGQGFSGFASALVDAMKGAVNESVSSGAFNFGAAKANDFSSFVSDEAKDQMQEAGKELAGALADGAKEAKDNGIFDGVTEDGTRVNVTGVRVDAEDLANAMGKVVLETKSDENISEIHEAVTKYLPQYAETMTTDSTNLSEVMSLMTMYLPYIPQLAALKVVLDSGALVGQIAPLVNQSLGDQAGLDERGGT